MPAALVVDHLTKTYSTSTGISDITFQANSGEIFGLLGPNGAGKTTTIRTISTMLGLTGGQVSIDGLDILQHPTEARRHIGVLTTDIGVYDRFSGRENLQYFGKLYGLEKSALDTRISELARFLDMENYLDQKAGTYSTGMKQKLAIARAIIHNPKVMMLDEPTTGLDVLASQTVLNFMQDCKKNGNCVIFSTHNMLDADQLCDRVAIINGGKLVALDTPAGIKKKAGADNLAEAFLKVIRAG